jgi:hemerythrin-like metal-binding protein/PAS domain S-box-containing protein
MPLEWSHANRERPSMNPDLPPALQVDVLEWLRAPRCGGAGHLVAGLQAGSALIGALAIGYLAWRRKDRQDRRLAALGACALALFALTRLPDAAGTAPASPLQVGGALVFLFAAYAFARLVVRMAAAPSLSQARALGEAHAERRLESLAAELEAKVRAQTAELHETEARLTGFIRHAPAAIVIKDLEGRFMLINPRYAAVLGRPEAEILGKTLQELVPLELSGPWLERERRVTELGEEVQYEEEYPRPDGSASHYLAHKFPLVDSQGRCWGVGVILTDITGHKEAEQARLRDRKLESLGILAGGLAHDFNNLLGAMEGNVELAKLAAERDGPVQSYLRTLDGLITRSADLVQQILAYAGRGKRQVVPMDLNRQVEEMTRLLRASLARKAALRLAPDPALPPIEGDPAQVQQMIMNLVINAAEAVTPPDGVITIRTGQETLDEAALCGPFQGQGLEPGPHVFLEVADNGPGMTPEVRERIFDPFFSTKFAGRGLGLSAVLGTLRAHRGGIQVRSEPGKGTSFKLLFPAAASAELPEPREAQDFEAAIGTYRGAGMVLVVDDEEPLRATVVEALRFIGFKTLEARDGLEALQVFEGNREQIRLVLLDLTMPRLDGEETYRELRGNGMMAPVILTSGFSEQDVRQHFRARGIAGFLQKPFRLPALVQMIRKIMDDEDHAGEARPLEARKPLVAEADILLGTPVLDQQHRQLLDAFNLLVGTLGPGGRKPEQEKAVANLKDVALTHFGVEETLMESRSYPRTREHVLGHVRLIRQINEVSERIHRGTLGMSPALLDFLESWLIHHMQDEDRRLAQFLRAKGH